MANLTKSQLLESWLDDTKARLKSASAKVGLDKEAADKEALEMKDPNEKGEVAPKANHPGANRSMLELPPKGNNNGEANKEHNIMGTTAPNGVGQGEYPATINGVAIDEKFNSFTGPLAKMAQQLRNGVATLGAQQQAVPQDVQVNSTVDADMFSKLAHIGAAVVGSEDGQQVVQEILSRRCGEQEAALMINAAKEDLYKAAAAGNFTKQAGDDGRTGNWIAGIPVVGSKLKSLIDNEPMRRAAWRSTVDDGVGTGLLAGATGLGHTLGGPVGAAVGAGAGILSGMAGVPFADYLVDKWYNKLDGAGQAADAVADAANIEKPASANMTPEMVKYASACVQSHDAWLNYFQTELEKQAYAQGAVDGEQAAQALAQGQEPAIDGAGEEGLSDEDIVQVIQAMAESGEIAPEEAQAVLSQLDSDPTLDEVAAILEQAVQNQEITPEDAQAIAMQLTGGGAAPEAAPEGAPAPEAAPVDPEAAAAAQEGVAKAASVLNQLFA